MKLNFCLPFKELLAGHLISGTTSSPEYCGVHLEITSTRILVMATDKRALATFVSRGHVAGFDAEVKTAALFVDNGIIERLDKLGGIETLYIQIHRREVKFYCGDVALTIDYPKVLPKGNWKTVIREQFKSAKCLSQFGLNSELLAMFGRMAPLLTTDPLGEGYTVNPKVIIEPPDEYFAIKIRLEWRPDFIGALMPMKYETSPLPWTLDWVGNEQAVLLPEGEPLPTNPKYESLRVLSL